MKKLTNLTLALALMIAPSVVNAQSTGESYTTYNFVQVQGGLQLPFTPGNRTDLMQPTFGLNVGRWFAPVIGARVGVEGLNSKVKLNEKYDKFSYLNFDLDALFNVLPFFLDDNDGKLKAYIIGGFGLNYLTDKGARAKSPKSDIAHNLRVGLGADYQLSKALSLSLEYRLNNTADYFNGRESTSDDWFSSLMVGLAYNFGHKEHSVIASVAPVAATAAAKSQSLFDQMEAGVNERMNTWMKRLKGESKADYLVRTSEEAIKTQRLEYTKAIATDLAGDRANKNVSDLVYNTNQQLLGVKFTDMPTITLKVPEADVTSFKNPQDIQFTNTIYNLNPGDEFEIIYTDAVNPVTGKKYNYIATREGKQVSTEGYLPVAAVQQNMENTVRLQQMAEKAVQAAKDQNILTDNTTISVSAKMEPKTDGKGDYHINYKYTVNDAFSVKDDFAPGKYDADQSAASVAMLNIIKKTLNEEFAEYMAAGKAVHISYLGSADAKPINGKIAYSGKYGDIKDQAVKVNGKMQKLTVTKATGITSNEQLSLVRAISVKNYLQKNIKALKDLKQSEDFSVEVSTDEGSQFRRVSVDFTFYDVNY